MQKGGDGRVIFRILLTVDTGVARAVGQATAGSWPYHDKRAATSSQVAFQPDACRAIDGLCVFAHAVFCGGGAMLRPMMQSCLAGSCCVIE